jgi:hypothetical protein
MHNLEIVTAGLVNKWGKEIWFAVEFGSDNEFFIQGCSHGKYRLDECGHEILVFHELSYSESVLNAYRHDKRLVKTKSDVTFWLWISREKFWFVNATIEFCWFMKVATESFHSWM